MAGHSFKSYIIGQLFDCYLGLVKLVGTKFNPAVSQEGGSSKIVLLIVSKLKALIFFVVCMVETS